MILSINAGSSSLKIALYDRKERGEFAILTEGRWERDTRKLIFKANSKKYEERIKLNEYVEVLEHVLRFLQQERFIEDQNNIKLVAHRAVNGGSIFTETTLITDDVLLQFKALKSLAPLHNPINLECAIQARKLIPNAEHYFVFDTAFHCTIPKVNQIYALPYECYEDGIQVYGFHGTSHENMMRKTAEELNMKVEDLNAITCHLGNGSSISCIKKGICIDTSMGMTPLDGLAMGTRCGHLDPGIYPNLVEKYGSVENVDRILNKKSGLLGISGVSSDMRILLKLRSEGNNRAGLAVDKFVQEIRKVIGSYLIELDYEVDAIAFSGGIGENCKEIVKEITSKLENIGVILSENPEEITTSNSKVKVLQLKADEELAMVKKVLDCYSKNH